MGQRMLGFQSLSQWLEASASAILPVTQVHLSEEAGTLSNLTKINIYQYLYFHYFDEASKHFPCFRILSNFSIFAADDSVYSDFSLWT